MSAPGAFGARLKAEREARGVDLDELSRATKVRRVLLEALEAERWSEMPTRVFVVGYLRAIAEHLHTDPAALQSGLEEAWPAQAPPAQPAPAGEEVDGSRGLHGGWAALALLGAGAGITAWLYLRPVPPPVAPEAPPGAAAMSAQDSPLPPPPSVSGVVGPEGEGATPAEPAPEGADPGPVAAAPPASAPEEQIPPAVPPSRESPAPPQAAAPAAAPPAAPHGDLWIEVSAPCWMELFSGGRRLVFRQVQAGERLSFDGREFTLTVGDAAACRVLWRGAPVSLPTETGKVVRGMALGEAPP